VGAQRHWNVVGGNGLGLLLKIKIPKQYVQVFEVSFLLLFVS